MSEKPQAAARLDADALAGEPLDEPKTDPSIRVVKNAMRSELNWQGAKLTIATVVVAVGTAFGAYRVVLSEALAQTDAGVAPVLKRVETLERDQKHLSEDVHEVQQDIRSLYRAVMTGRPQERLENPPVTKDGGQ
jgi:hypothetical protein